MSHTPGKWNYFGPMKTGYSSEFYGVGNGEKLVCQTGGDMEIRFPNNLDEQRANAVLIAAAPEMLSALRFVRQAVHQAHHDGPIEGCPRNTCAEMDRVIRRAEGLA